VSGLLQETGARSLARCIASISLEIQINPQRAAEIQTWKYMDWQNTAPAALAHLFVICFYLPVRARYTTALHSETAEIYYIYWLRTRPMLQPKRLAPIIQPADKFG